MTQPRKRRQVIPISGSVDTITTMMLDDVNQTAPQLKKEKKMFPKTLRNTPAPDYRLAAAIFWPRHANLIYDARDEINERIYNGELPNVPVLVGLTPHARSLGYCEMRSPPVITLHPSLTEPHSTNPWGVPARHLNAAWMVDVLTHEMVHAWHAVNPPAPTPTGTPPTATTTRTTTRTGAAKSCGNRPWWAWPKSSPARGAALANP